MSHVNRFYNNSHNAQVESPTLNSTNDKAFESNSEYLSNLGDSVSRNVAKLHGADSIGAITSVYRGCAEAIAQKSDFFDKAAPQSLERIDSIIVRMGLKPERLSEVEGGEA